MRIVALKVPAKDPEKKENWKTEVLSEELNVTHNFWPQLAAYGNKQPFLVSILVASYDGVHTLMRQDDKWVTTRNGEGNQANPKASRGASEIKSGVVGAPSAPRQSSRPSNRGTGTRVVTYTKPKAGGSCGTARHRRTAALGSRRLVRGPRR